MYFRIPTTKDCLDKRLKAPVWEDVSTGDMLAETLIQS